MSIRELSLGAFLTFALALVTYGVALVYEPAAWVVCGLGVAGIGALFLIEART